MYLYNLRDFIFVIVLYGALSAAAPAVHKDAIFEVREKLGVPYAQGVLCDAKPCVRCTGGLLSNGPKGCTEDCQSPEPGSAGSASKGCPRPQLYNLTLDLYTPIGAESLGPRPALVAIHSGGYSVNGERGFAPSYEMTRACRYFAARGYVAITMVYRLNNHQTGGGLAPANWTGPTPLPKGWKGGFLPPPQSIYPAIRDTKAAIRWLRGQANSLHLATDFFASAGWSAGACTSVFLATQHDGDFTREMDAQSDPAFKTLIPYLNQTSGVRAGVVWAGNGVATDTFDAFDGQERYRAGMSPLAMYRGVKDNTMTPWAQQEVQTKFNATGSRCDLFGVPGHGHGDLMPEGLVATQNGVPLPGPHETVLNHSFAWIAARMGLLLV